MCVQKKLRRFLLAFPRLKTSISRLDLKSSVLRPLPVGFEHFKINFSDGGASDIEITAVFFLGIFVCLAAGERCEM